MKRRVAIDLLADEVFRRLLRDSGNALADPRGYLLRTAAQVEKDLEGQLQAAGTEPTPQQVQAAVDTLPPRQRQVLQLHLGGLRYPDIASLLTISEGAVLQDLANAYQYLQWKLAERR